ncbi:valine--tRNA ligase [Candidatus Adlerbacteria bacterium RIFCSPHIGHO2_12_FULL_53_18]|uniref:Valine--tRNA ligase n=1 Tax=Candidatus Adlerbacteria bacterium RIFCSPHIGHO2_12_FULL_53_18 TaxID=1797242 RepID=A0A1F4XSM5_9BACT|nr:MAG: valine--tRNA ligase [Candidatus Adlerbacteria bacterium RIFCSPHIGHO2_12_FULL_53_18]
MPEKFTKPYNPVEVEGAIYKKWEDSGYFNPDKLPGERTESFSIVLPPPNVTGSLHLGHAYEDTLQDIVIRFQRMRGKKVLWLPGTDSAAIATQARVEKNIQKEEKKTRHDLGREELVKRVHEFAKSSETTILSQVRKMGASLDWSRYAYTLDEKRNLAVLTAFKRMYDAGLIYRGHRIVNWDPKGQTTISDDEVMYEEEKGTFYYFQYGPFVIGTSRPETKFGDKYVVMHPDDSRYKDYTHGQKIELEWINGPITATVIKDTASDPEMGSGAMTITPWHSMADFEIAERHGLDKEQVIDRYGKLLPIAGEFAGMKISEAREKIVEKLRQKGLVVKVDDAYTHNIATSERTGATIEPQVMEQWFIAVNKSFVIPHSEIPGITSGSETTLKDIMRAAVESGAVDMPQEGFRKTYFHWIENLYDWCISRQIWFGHRIPVWYREQEVYCGVTPPEGDGWEQDPDVLDTWFSSALWTFSTLGWPEDTKDLETFHPTSFMSPAYEILQLWVSRMILMSGFHLGQVPFKKVMIHGLVRAKDGRKFSKSLNNGVDPLEMIEKYGADALRMGLIVGAVIGSDIRFDEQKVKAYKLFANKVWNIARFVLSQERTGDIKTELKEEFDALAKEVTADMENYRVYMAAEKLYHYLWGRFAAEILEESKGKPEYGKTLYYILENSLKLLHPFMPFITEEIWNSMPGKKELLMVEEWPIK